MPGDSDRALRLTPEVAGTRLDVFLGAELTLSRAQVTRLLERGAVSLAGRRLSRSAKGMSLPAEGVISVAAFRARDDERAVPEESAGPPILARGPGWLAVDKPAGMPVHPLREDERGTVLGHLIAQHPEIHGVGEGGLRSGVVHRLDVHTSGVLLFANEEPAWRALREAFQSHAVAKRYRALVAGGFDPPGGELRMELPLVVARHRPSLVRVATEEEERRGRARVITQVVHVLEALDGATLVEVRPRSGFLHQIRASLAHLGHPVVGDDRYGVGSAQAAGLRERSGATRHMLHAAEVGWNDVAAEAPDPADFIRCRERLARR
jgi:23S rRNA pseudouridine1911/1915/1917 synthase